MRLELLFGLKDLLETNINPNPREDNMLIDDLDSIRLMAQRLVKKGVNQNEAVEKAQKKILYARGWHRARKEKKMSKDYLEKKGIVKFKKEK